MYMDDILVFAPSAEGMILRLRFLLQCLLDANLLINSEKCKLMMLTVPYLGNILEHGIVRPDPARVSCSLSSYSRLGFPATTSELRSFIGAAAMLKSHAPDYGYLKGLLHPLLSSKKPFFPDAATTGCVLRTADRHPASLPSASAQCKGPNDPADRCKFHRPWSCFVSA